MSMVWHVFIFSLGDDDTTRYALNLTDVERAVPSVAITSLADITPGLLGLIDVGGEAMPVLDPRPRFGLPYREQQLTDTIIVVRTAQGTAGLLVADVEGVRELDDDGPPAVGGELLSNLQGASPGVAMLDDGMALLYDIATLIGPRCSEAMAACVAGNHE